MISQANGSDNRSGAPAPDPCPPPPFQSVFQDLGALQAYAQHYVQARLDALKYSLRQIVLWAVLGLMGAVAGIAALFTAVVLLVNGLVDGLSVLLGDRIWAAELIVGGTFVGAAVAGLLWFRAQTNRKAFERTKENYARRREGERVAHQRDVVQQAAGGQRVGR